MNYLIFSSALFLAYLALRWFIVSSIKTYREERDKQKRLLPCPKVGNMIDPFVETPCGECVRKYHQKSLAS